MTSPAGSIPPTGQGLTAALAEKMSMAHSSPGSRLAMPQIDREHLVMPHNLSSPRVAPQSLNSPEAQYAKMYPRPTQATSTLLRGGLQYSPEPAPKGPVFAPSHDSLIRAKQSGLYASRQDASNMASLVETRDVSSSPTDARLVSAAIAGPSHQREASKGSTGRNGRGASAEMVPSGDHAERELWSQLQATQKFSRGEVTPRE